MLQAIDTLVDIRYVLKKEVRLRCGYQATLVALKQRIAELLLGMCQYLGN